MSNTKEFTALLEELLEHADPIKRVNEGLVTGEIFNYEFRLYTLVLDVVDGELIKSTRLELWDMGAQSRAIILENVQELKKWIEEHNPKEGEYQYIKSWEEMLKFLEEYEPDTKPIKFELPPMGLKAMEAFHKALKKEVERLFNQKEEDHD